MSEVGVGVGVDLVEFGGWWRSVEWLGIKMTEESGEIGGG